MPGLSFEELFPNVAVEEETAMVRAQMASAAASEASCLRLITCGCT